MDDQYDNEPKSVQQVDNWKPASSLSCGDIVFAISRVMLYLSVAVCGIAISILMSMNNVDYRTPGDNDNKKLSSCILNIKASLYEAGVDPNTPNPCVTDTECTSDFECLQFGNFSCQEIKEKNNQEYCAARQCIYIQGAKTLSPCTFSYSFAAVSGVFALTLAGYNIYNLVKRNNDALKAGCSTWLMILITFGALCASCALVGVVTNDFRLICNQFNAIPGLTCATASNITDFDGNKVLPGNFYNDLTLAERLTWANSVAWALLFFTTMLRYWIAKRNDAKSNELSVSADDKTLFGDETDA